MKIFEITADYRPKNPNKPIYYVWGNSKAEAKRRFSQKLSWLEIYGCEEIMDEKMCDTIINKAEQGKVILI